MQKQDQSTKSDKHEEITPGSEESLPRSNGTIEEVHEKNAPEESQENNSVPEKAQEQDEKNVANGVGTITAQAQRGGFDWPALLGAAVIAAFFALTARFNSQPSPSYIPAAVFSATGCGLLVTAIHKLRGRAGVGLWEAGLAGFGLALLQFAVTFTYPGVTGILANVPDYTRAFLVTWGLVAFCAVILSLAGATIGHLTFAPLRPLPARPVRQQSPREDEDGAEDAQDEEIPSARSEDETSISEAENEMSGDEVLSHQKNEDETYPSEQDDDPQPGEESGEEEEETVEEETPVTSTAGRIGTRSSRSLLNYGVVVLLLGLLPMMGGYVFAATYDFLMNALNVNSISPALYPTLSLLGGLLPWRLAVPINLNSANGTFIVFTLLWRVPDSVLGNPNLFDVQALEPLLFTATGLAFLLITMYKKEHHADQRQSAPLGAFLLLEALLGLILVLPANLWLLRGLEGVLELQSLVVPLPTVHLLNPTLFTLNLATGILFALIVALVVRRQYQLWTTPRVKNRDQQSS